MIDNFWMLLAQVMVASFVLMFAISFLLMPVFVLLNNYKEKREKSEMATIILLKQLTQENQDKDFTMEDFLKATKNK